MMLELDYSNVLESSVGVQGIPKGAFGKTAESGLQIVRAVEDARTSGKLGFMDIPFDDAPVKAMTDFAKAHSYPTVLIIGIGGSALGPMALDSALAKLHLPKRLVTVDNIDPDFIHDTLETLRPEETLVNIIAKSGVTAETMATYAVVRQWLVDKLGESKARDHFVATTDPEKGDLLAIARSEKMPVFAIPANVGG